MKFQTFLILTFFAILSGSKTPAEERLFWHSVRLDSEGKLLSWVQGNSPYDEVIRRAWGAFKNIPEQPNGYKTYFTYPVFYGPNDKEQALFAGRNWTHNPGSLFAMLTDSAMLYYAYSGDEEVMPLIKAMLDQHITKGSTRPTDAWAEVPYASADGGSEYYRGATDTKYVQDEKYLGRGDGVGFIQPDKVGELGLAYLRFYEYSLDKKYLDAATKCANALAKHIREGDEGHSPWPFRVDALTGRIAREEYTSNTIGPIRLLDEMIRLGEGDVGAYRTVRDSAWRWLMKYPVQNNIWTQYFEDIYVYPDYRTNLNQYCPLETVRYLLEHPERDPDWKEHSKSIIEWVRGFFAADSVTMGGLAEKGIQWGAEVLSEQVNDMDKMSSHTARWASVLALWYERTGDVGAKQRAFRSFNWASYSCSERGLVKTSLDEGTGYWFSDGYGDYMRHFQRGIASVPQWAPVDEDHMLRSSTIVQSIKYKKDKIMYKVFDEKSRELFKVGVKPKEILVAGEKIPLVNNLREGEQCYTVEPVENGGFALRINHCSSGRITINLPDKTQ